MSSSAGMDSLPGNVDDLFYIEKQKMELEVED
jgi:hypothetical protein